ncbi:hypothetical protein [Bradyrhizobium iriomotense]|uniref:hypothetical protein n=1 Tax=Bradyrhizobium iriomotense TaxID=441950 RepID=UPI0024E11278|nr:hypothetical protein [Bradyrhizobium iriomotense]
MRRPLKSWEILIRDHHEGYICWQDYENNQRIINGNANMKGEMVPGSVRNCGGLLVGLLRCRHCGGKLRVQHNGLRGVAGTCATMPPSIMDGGPSVLHSQYADRCGGTGSWKWRASSVLQTISSRPS